MAYTQDMEHHQTTLNSPGPLGSEQSGIHTQIADPQGRQPQQLICVEVTVLRAHNVPQIKNRFGGKTRFYVTIAHKMTKKTEGVQIEGQTVQWNQRLDAFNFLQTTPSFLTLCLYAKSLARRDILIGKYEIPVEPRINVPFVLGNGDGQAGQSTQAVTLYLTISVSMNEAHFESPTDLVITQAPMGPSYFCVSNSVKWPAKLYHAFGMGPHIPRKSLPLFRMSWAAGVHVEALLDERQFSGNSLVRRCEWYDLPGTPKVGYGPAASGRPPQNGLRFGWVELERLVAIRHRHCCEN
ncbi:hypothetical protein EDB86DRAFT_3244632 [Lactarius hatsudake]|nr:hypothetical protein EDB86DRAFT_3244632 [Lactarius hatsudake]